MRWVTSHIEREQHRAVPAAAANADPSPRHGAAAATRPAAVALRWRVKRVLTAGRASHGPLTPSFEASMDDPRTRTHLGRGMTAAVSASRLSERRSGVSDTLLEHKRRRSCGD